MNHVLVKTYKYVSDCFAQSRSNYIRGNNQGLNKTNFQYIHEKDLVLKGVLLQLSKTLWSFSYTL